ncbi:MAG TPA: hypothetical protein VF834_21290 [Streptosporangiaceae bacterium]
MFVHILGGPLGHELGDAASGSPTSTGHVGAHVLRTLVTTTVVTDAVLAVSN